MALLKRKPPPVAELATIPHRSALTASSAAVKLEGQTWRTWRFGDETWQQEAWRLYDIIGELRFIANWIGSALSRVRIYVAHVDRNGRIQKEVEEARIAAISDSIFGNPAAKAEALRLLGINLSIAGAAYVLGTTTGDGDQWQVLSASELRSRGDRVWYEFGDGSKEDIDISNSILFRVWTPHPRRIIWPDSPTRAAMPILWEIERLTRFVFAQIDSRLASAGLLFLPKEVSFPDNDTEFTGVEALTDRLMTAAASSLKGEGTAAGVVPIMAELPADVLGKVQLLTFSSELSDKAKDLRSEAIRRLGLAMDIDPSVLAGLGDSNHWGAWQIQEGMVKVHIEPMMTRICDALTQAYLWPAIQKIAPGKDPKRYTFAFDTAPLTVRPQRLKDTMDMYKEGHVSRETVLLAGDYKISDLPSDEEDARRYVREIMLRDPNLLTNPTMRSAAGLDSIIPPETAITSGKSGPPPPPAPPDGLMQHTPAPTPENSQAQNNPAGPPELPAGTPANVVAAASVPSPITTFVVANSAVVRALEMGGKRLLTRGERGQHANIPAYELHTVIPVAGVDQARKALDGAWDHLSALTATLGIPVDETALRDTLHMYCLSLMVDGKPHDYRSLAAMMRTAGLLGE